jgi:hypothetical protein
MRMAADGGNEMKRILEGPGSTEGAAVVVDPQQVLQPELESATLQVFLLLTDALLHSIAGLMRMAGDP